MATCPVPHSLGPRHPSDGVDGRPAACARWACCPPGAPAASRAGPRFGGICHACPAHAFHPAWRPGTFVLQELRVEPEFALRGCASFHQNHRVLWPQLLQLLHHEVVLPQMLLLTRPLRTNELGNLHRVVTLEAPPCKPSAPSTDTTRHLPRPPTCPARPETLRPRVARGARPRGRAGRPRRGHPRPPAGGGRPAPPRRAA